MSINKSSTARNIFRGPIKHTHKAESYTSGMLITCSNEIFKFTLKKLTLVLQCFPIRIVNLYTFLTRYPSNYW